MIGVSQSGQSPDIVAAVESGRRQGALTLAITNETDSPLALAAEHTLPLLAGEERETSHVLAEPYSPADLRHGPMAMIDRGFPVLLVASSGRVLDDLEHLTDLLERRSGELIAISDDPDVLERARTPLSLPPGVPEWVSPMVSVVPGQLFAVALARTRGLDPDAPRGLSQVTETR